MIAHKKYTDKYICQFSELKIDQVKKGGVNQ